MDTEAVLIVPVPATPEPEPVAEAAPVVVVVVDEVVPNDTPPDEVALMIMAMEERVMNRIAELDARLTMAEVEAQPPVEIVVEEPEAPAPPPRASKSEPEPEAPEDKPKGYGGSYYADRK